VGARVRAGGGDYSTPPQSGLLTCAGQEDRDPNAHRPAAQQWHAYQEGVSLVSSGQEEELENMTS
jgi:hypothetical protein